ncbi:GL13165 [Drosophila persimilis]|uniref:GL13165 n=1 Tax=Drosophila persimilis TaxID=7234 RepID=B4HDA7_DROPE|nr:GL13165 [Drosophila persimilis]
MESHTEEQPSGYYPGEFVANPGVSTGWMHKRRRDELESFAEEFGFSPEGNVEDLRRSFAELVAGPLEHDARCQVGGARAAVRQIARTNQIATARHGPTDGHYYSHAAQRDGVIYPTPERLFLAFFLPPRYFEQLEDHIRDRKQAVGEAFKDFVIELRLLMHHAGYDEAKELSRICDNTLPAYQLYVRRHELRSIQERSVPAILIPPRQPPRHTRPTAQQNESGTNRAQFREPHWNTSEPAQETAHRMITTPPTHTQLVDAAEKLDMFLATAPTHRSSSVGNAAGAERAP